MRTPVLAAVAAFFLVLCGEAKPEPDFLTDRVGWQKAQLRCARDLAYTEARGEGNDGQRLVVWVAAQRALENRSYWGGGTICKVAYKTSRNKKGELVSEFTGMQKPVQLPDDHPDLVRADRNARAVLLGGWEPKANLKLARFYQNPKHADPARSTWFQKLQAVGWVGNHLFYREHNKSPG